MFKNTYAADPMMVPFMFPFLTTEPSRSTIENNENIHETIHSVESFLPETVYNSFIKTEEVQAKSINPNKVVVTYKSREKTNDNPVINKDKTIIITPRNKKTSTKRKKIASKGKTRMKKR
tara:strand:- start:290 stop:649 length:360 start_codon:yes stop_codon:yes gene_type:complete